MYILYIYILYIYIYILSLPRPQAAPLARLSTLKFYMYDQYHDKTQLKLALWPAPLPAFAPLEFLYICDQYHHKTHFVFFDHTWLLLRHLALPQTRPQAAPLASLPTLCVIPPLWYMLRCMLHISPTAIPPL